MRPIVIVALLAFGFCLSSCHRETPLSPKPQGKGLGLPDVSHVRSTDGRKLSSSVLRDRMLSGHWSGGTPDGVVSVVISAGSASIEVDRADGAMIAGGSGPMAWSPDGTLSGSFSGVAGVLAPFARWTAGFVGPDRMSMSGAGGARLDLRRRTAVPLHGGLVKGALRQGPAR